MYGVKYIDLVPRAPFQAHTRATEVQAVKAEARRSTDELTLRAAADVAQAQQAKRELELLVAAEVGARREAEAKLEKYEKDRKESERIAAGMVNTADLPIACFSCLSSIEPHAVCSDDGCLDLIKLLAELHCRSTRRQA